MPNVTLSGHTGIKESSFNIVAAFEEAVADFEASDISIVAVDGNGVTGVDIGTITGSGVNRVIPINLPADAEGSFEFDITGEVTPERGLSRTWGGISISGFATSVNDVENIQTSGTTDILVIAYMTGTDDATFINSVNTADYPNIIIQQGSNTQTLSFSSKGSQLNIPGVSGGVFRYFIVSNINASGLTDGSDTTITFRGASEEVTLNPVTIQYDTNVAVTASFGALTYDLNKVTIPFTTSEDLVSISPTDFRILQTSGNGIYESDFECIGSGIDWKLLVTIPLGYKGVLSIELFGNVITTANPNIHDAPSSPILLIPYNTTEPDIEKFDIPDNIASGENYIYIDFDQLCIGLRQRSFEYGGTVDDPNMPILQAANTSARPSANSTDWEDYNDNTQPRMYFRIKFTFPDPPPIGHLNAILKDYECFSVDMDDVSPIAPDIPDAIAFNQNQQFSYTYNWQLPNGVTIIEADIMTGTLPAGITISHTDNSISIGGNPTVSGNISVIIEVLFSDSSPNYTKTISINVAAESQSQSRGRGVRGKEQSSARQSADPALNMPDAVIYLGEDFTVSGTIVGNPINVYVEGLLRNWTYNSDSGALDIMGSADDVEIEESGVWKVFMDSVEDEVNWTAIKRPPVITNPGTKTAYLNHAMRIPISITQLPAGVTLKGLLASMFFENYAEGSDLLGAPDRVVTSAENRMIRVDASTSGGDDEEEFKLIVVDETPAGMSDVIATPGVGQATFTWDAVTNAESYAYRIGEIGEWIDVGNVTTHIIEGLSNGVSYMIYWRINSVWISDPISTEVELSNMIGHIDLHADNTGAEDLTIIPEDEKILVLNDVDGLKGWFIYGIDGSTDYQSISFSLTPHTDFVSGAVFNPDTEELVTLKGTPFQLDRFSRSGTYNGAIPLSSPHSTTSVKGLAYDTVNNEYLVVDRNPAIWHRYNSFGTRIGQRILHSSTNNPGGITFDTTNEEVLINQGLGWHRYELDGTFLGIVATSQTISFPNSTCFDPRDNTVLVVDALADNIVRFELNGDFVETIEPYLVNESPEAVIFDSIENHFYVPDVGIDKMFRYNSDFSNTPEGFRFLNLENATPSGIVYIPVLDQVWVTDSQDDDFYMYETNGDFIDNVSLNSQNRLSAAACYHNTSREVLVADRLHIYRYSINSIFIDRTTLRQVSGNPAQSNDNPNGVDIDTERLEMLVLDPLDMVWYRYTQEGVYISMRRLSDEQSNPFGILYNPINGEILVTDKTLKRLYRYTPGA